MAERRLVKLERIGGPRKPPKGMECLLETPGRKATAPLEQPGCQHGDNSIQYISTVILLKILKDGGRVLACENCGRRWIEDTDSA